MIPHVKPSKLSNMHIYTSSHNPNSLDSELAYVKANSEYIVGFTVWGGGSFDTTYIYDVAPNADGSDQPIWTDAGEWLRYISPA